MSTKDTEAHLLMRSIIQCIATGPEFSRDISQEQALLGTQAIFAGQIDPVQAAIFFIALRMKRESFEEYKGVLDAIRDTTLGVTADVDEVLDIADPYDGYNRTLPAAPFLPPLLADCGIHVISHGVDTVGPKYGVTHRHVLEAAGVDVDLATEQAAARLSDESVGWSYIDQAQFCPKLHDLIPLRTQMVKRSVLATVEVLLKPITGRHKTHFVTGYVHESYPAIYAMLARHLGFDSALLIQGVEGGVTPPLRQDGKYFAYHDRGEAFSVNIHPEQLGIDQAVRSVPLPEDLPKAARPGDEIAIAVDIKDTALAAADVGMAALNGSKGATYDSLVYTGALVLKHLGRHADLKSAASQVRDVLDSGNAASRVK
jgi:anthranilate phosphoribosyltransferase